MKTNSMISILALVSLQSTAFGDELFPSEPPLVETISRLKPDFDSANRCTTDQLADDAMALARIEWAHVCKRVNKTDWDEEYRTRKDPITRKRVARSKLAYPIFVYDDISNPLNLYPIWTPPAILDRAPTEADCAAIPANVKFFGICEAGCYRPDQRIAFSNGYKDIESASLLKSQSVVVLSAESTLSSLKYKTAKIAQFTSSIKEGKERLREFKTLSGTNLHVTKNHPIVDQEGRVKEAGDFSHGDSFVRADGQLDPIISIRDYDFYGRVFNLQPTGTDAAENILIAEGVLNGSQGYQNGDIKDLNRLVKRSLPEASLLPK